MQLFVNLLYSKSFTHTANVKLEKTHTNIFWQSKMWPFEQMLLNNDLA